MMASLWVGGCFDSDIAPPDATVCWECRARVPDGGVAADAGVGDVAMDVVPSADR